MLTLDPIERNSTVLSVAGRDFRDGELCYFDIVPANFIGHPVFDYVIDINITMGKGVIITVTNGTSMWDSDGTMRMEFTGDNNDTIFLTRSASLLPRTAKPNHVFLMLTADPEYD